MDLDVPRRDSVSPKIIGTCFVCRVSDRGSSTKEEPVGSRVPGVEVSWSTTTSRHSYGRRGRPPGSDGPSFKEEVGEEGLGGEEGVPDPSRRSKGVRGVNGLLPCALSRLRQETISP